jgi:hypothetical protein
MESLIIKPSDRFLSVSLDADSGKLTFSGRSLPEDGKAFFTPIIDWLKKYSHTPAAKTECTFRMEYFNSSSRKCFVDLFDALDSIREKGNSIAIIWEYEEADDELLEMGEEYEKMYDLDFEFRPY